MSDDVLDQAVAARRAALMARVRTGEYLDAQQFAPLQWVVPGLIPEGFGLFTGRPKVGKSWAALSIGLSLATARPAFGRIPIEVSRPVLLLALEDGERRLKGRCRKLLGDVPIPPQLHYITTAEPNEILDLIDGWLDVHGHAAPLVILDTLGKVMPPSQPGESAYQRDYRIGSSLKRRSDRHIGSTVLVVHHERKAAGREGDWMDSTSGTNGLAGAYIRVSPLSQCPNRRSMTYPPLIPCPMWVVFLQNGTTGQWGQGDIRTRTSPTAGLSCARSAARSSTPCTAAGGRAHDPAALPRLRHPEPTCTM